MYRGTSGQSGLRSRAVDLPSLSRSRLVVALKNMGVSGGHIQRKLSRVTRTLCPLPPVHRSPVEEEGMGAFPGFLLGAGITPLECTC